MVKEKIVYDFLEWRDDEFLTRIRAYPTYMEKVWRPTISEQKSEYYYEILKDGWAPLSISKIKEGWFWNRKIITCYVFIKTQVRN